MTAAPATTWTCPTCGNAYPSDFSVCPRDATPRADGAGPITDALLGEVLARTYRLVRVLGEGGMARLYEAEHLRVETRYAVKVIHEDLSRVPDLLVRFEREARAAGRISSDHVVRVIDVLRTNDGRPCIVTELLHGEDLQARLNKVGKLAPFDAIPIARQICRALAAAHACGVVHRDLKPSNVFLCEGEGEMVVKVFDFGVAKLEDDEKLTRTDAVMGTPAYMAPEQARRAAEAGPLADLYTCGAVLYHMLTGEPPYGKAPPTSRLALVLHEEPARPRSIEPSIPEGLEAVVQHAMARDPGSRVQTAMELDAELAAFDTIAQASRPAGEVRVAPSSDIGSTAEQISLRARTARPSAAALVVASSLAAGLWADVLIAALFRLGANLTGTELSLVGLLAAATMMAIAMVQIRVLRPRWSSIPAVWAHARLVGRTLLTGIAALGALELAARGVAVIARSGDGGIAWRAGLAGVAAVIALFVQRRRRRR
jgi:serine/threonine-protein kinase